MTLNKDPNHSTWDPYLEVLVVERGTADTDANGAQQDFTLTTSAMSTVTIDTTLLRTTFVTVTTYPALSGTTTVLSSSTTPLSSTPTSQSSPGAGNEHTTSSSISSRRPLRSKTTSATNSQEPRHTSTPTPPPEIGENSNISNQQRKAIIVSLSTVIAGLIIVAILVVLLLWRRQRRTARSLPSSEAGLRNSMSRNWSQATSNRTVRTVRNPTPPMSRQSSHADFNGSVIRISLGGFARPFAHHQSFRESMGPGRLTVMNPDNASELHTPVRRSSIESSNTYFKRQRSAIAAAFLGSSHSRANSNTPSHRRGPSIPAIAIDPVLSSETLPRSQPAPSFRSYTSVTSGRTVLQQPPDDPFLTPPDERMETLAPSLGSFPQRPGRVARHNTAGSAGKTLSSLGQALNPFRRRSSMVDDEEEGTASRHSTTTFSSNGDPFRLDSRSMRDRSSAMMERSPQKVPPAHISPSRLYEGT